MSDRTFGDTAYVLCGHHGCDRRRGHPGRHSWEDAPEPPARPHGCLEERVATLERGLADLARQVATGPDPRLWAGDPHDGGRR